MGTRCAPFPRARYPPSRALSIRGYMYTHTHTYTSFFSSSGSVNLPAVRIHDVRDVYSGSCDAFFFNSSRTFMSAIFAFFINEFSARSSSLHSFSCCAAWWRILSYASRILFSHSSFSFRIPRISLFRFSV